MKIELPCSLYNIQESLVILTMLLIRCSAIYLVYAYTLPTAEILSGKNARAWVSMALYSKKLIKIKIFKQTKNAGSRFEVAS